jgi:S-adenosylmethionine-diacylglycerol 3-amino-3-carboxypropyl transferase
MSRVHFAQIREDGRVERRLRVERGARRVVCIGSGGCTALSLLEDGVDVVFSVDSNPAQCAVLELKRAAVAELDRESYLAFVGEREGRDRLETYAQLAPDLPAFARAYWDEHPDEVALGANQCGATERFYRFLGGNLRESVVPEDVWRRLLDCDSLDEQRELHARHFRTEAWRTALRVLLSRTTHLAFYPAFMFEQAMEHSFGDFFAAQFEREVLSKSLGNNYFLTQLLFASYRYDRPEGTPLYLDDAGWERTRRNLHKLVVVPRPVEAFLRETESIDAFFLSNVFDWMTPAGREDLWASIVSSATPRAVLLFRNMLSAHPPSLADRFHVDEAQSAASLELERSMLYQKITVGVLS